MPDEGAKPVAPPPIPGTRRYEKPGSGKPPAPGAGAAGTEPSGNSAPSSASSRAPIPSTGGSGPGVAPEGAKGLLAKATPLDAVLALLIIALGVTFWLPSHWEASRRANEAAALAFEREVFELEQKYRSQKGAYAPSFFELAAAGAYQGPAPEAGLVTRDGYIFKITPLQSDCARWYATAVPAGYGSTGDRSYYVDDTGKVHVSEGPISGPAFPEAP
jgi:hypothetical protein